MINISKLGEEVQRDIEEARRHPSVDEATKVTVEDGDGTLVIQWTPHGEKGRHANE